jgi:hypothetical protein
MVGFSDSNNDGTFTWQAMSGEGSSVDTKASDKWHENVTPIRASW